MGAQPIFFYALRDKARPLKDLPEMKRPFVHLIRDKTDLLEVAAWIDLTITFVEGNDSGNETML